MAALAAQSTFLYSKRHARPPLGQAHTPSTNTKPVLNVLIAATPLLPCQHWSISGGARESSHTLTTTSHHLCPLSVLVRPVSCSYSPTLVIQCDPPGAQPLIELLRHSDSSPRLRQKTRRKTMTTLLTLPFSTVKSLNHFRISSSWYLWPGSSLEVLYVDTRRKCYRYHPCRSMVDPCLPVRLDTMEPHLHAPLWTMSSVNRMPHTIIDRPS